MSVSVQEVGPMAQETRSGSHSDDVMPSEVQTPTVDAPRRSGESLDMCRSDANNGDQSHPKTITDSER